MSAWMKSGKSGTAHTIKACGGGFLRTTCGTRIKQALARKVPVMQVERPGGGGYYSKPAVGEVCAECDEIEGAA